MKKNKKFAVKLLIASMALTANMSITIQAMTTQEVTSKNPTSYTSGTGSVYGPKLSQDQLNAVAQATADFITANITDDMSRDDKIKAAHDYLVNTVSYADDWSINSANTAYGALINHTAQCSGYSRAFKALCDAMDIPCYYIHADANALNPSHQWNMVEYSDGWYFIDVQANDSSGFDAIYHSSTHLMSYDVAAYPAIGSKTTQSQTTETIVEVEGWKQDANGWWYQNADGSYPQNIWKEIGGKYYYFGGDGYMLHNTITPDGYLVGVDGAWI